jgi:hypothetical protein
VSGCSRSKREKECLSRSWPKKVEAMGIVEIGVLAAGYLPMQLLKIK